MARLTKLELENRDLRSTLTRENAELLNTVRLLNEARAVMSVRDKRNAHLTAKLLAAQIVIFDQAQQIVKLRTKLADYRPADFILHDELSQMRNDFSVSISATGIRS